MKISDLALAAMLAGLNGEALPNLGPLSSEHLLMVNELYDKARNWAAGVAVKQS
jgi:hypothetical protein